MAKSQVDTLLKSHPNLTHSQNVKVVSHVQRKQDEWIINTIMLDNTQVPFKYKRKKRYLDLSGARVNLTYYPATESIAGFDIEVMNVVRIKVA